MTAAEWGRTGPAAPAAGPADSRWNSSLVALGEYGAAGLVLLLMSGALLGPVFDPEQTGEVGWLRTLWLPVYALILLLVGLRMRSLRTIAVPALLAAPLLLLALVSSEWSILPEVTVRRAVALSFTTLFGLWLAARFSWREAVGLVAGVSLVLAVGSCLMALLAPEIGTHATIHAGAWRGLWYEKNALGGAMALGVLACACAARLTPEGGRVWLGGAALCAGLVVMSTSTTALLAGVMIGVGFALIGGMRRGAASAVTTVWMALVAAGLAAGVFALAPDLIFQALGKDPSLTGRTEIWDAVLRRVQERPVLGYGFGAFWEDKGGPVGFVRNEVNWSAPTAHNGWLELLLSFGWTGVGLFALHLLVVAGAGLLSIRRGPEAYWGVIFLALFVLFSLSESTILQQNNLSWALYVMTGAKLLAPRRAVAQAPLRSRPAERAPPPARAAVYPPAVRDVAVPASRLSFVLGVAAVLILSRTWLRVPALFGGPSGSEFADQTQIVYVLGYTAAAMLAFSRLGDTLQLLWRAPLLTILMGLAGLSTLWSIAPGDTAFSVFALGGTVLIGAGLAGRFTWTELTEVLATSFAVMVVGSLIAGLLIPDVGRMQIHDGAWQGVFSHKNGLGGSMAMSAPVFAAAAAYNPARRRLWTVFAGLAVLLVFLSSSSTALLALGLGAGAFAAVLGVRRGGATAVAATYGALFGAAILAFVFLFARDSVAELFGKDATLSGRTEIWTAALRRIEERPWTGYGYGALWEKDSPDNTTAWMFLEARHDAANAHNAWLELWLGVGLLGVIAFSLLLAKVWIATALAAYRHGAALLAAPFLLAYSVTLCTESLALVYNDLAWAIFVAIAIKLTRWGQDPMTAAAVAPSGSERRASA